MTSNITWALAIVCVLLIISAYSAPPADPYGPWPGARPADDGDPVRSRPRDYRRVRILSPPTEREAAPPVPCGAAAPQPPYSGPIAELYNVPGYGETPAYLGPTPLASSCRTDDLGTVTTLSGAARAESHDPNSRGRNVSGLLASVELSA